MNALRTKKLPYHALVLGAALTLGALAPTSAQAGLMGNTIEGFYYFPNDTTLYGNFSYSVNPFIVAPGVESILTVDGSVTTDVDFSDDALVLTPTTNVTYTGTNFNGPQFAVLAGNPFSSILSVTASGGQSVTAALVSGVLQVNWQGQSFTPGDTVTVQFEGNVVPEPSTLAMLGAGGLVGFALRRRLRRV